MTWTETAPPRIGTAAGQACILCATPRSGTTLLCGMLADAGVGWPASYYRGPSIAAYARDMGVTPAPCDPGFDRAYLDAVRKTGTAGTDRFGMRLMWDSAPGFFAALARLYPHQPTDRARIQAAFGPTTFVHLSRRDKLAQAISRVRAERSGVWHRNADGTIREEKPPAAGPEFDAGAIAAHLATCRSEDAAWQAWFTAQGIRPQRLAYEDMADCPQTALRGILTAMGADPARADRVLPSTRRLADAISTAWARQFRAAQTER